jgi:2-oxoglutarate dehydrogenase E2 component (dihydrolipoamide succinyltransferase)
MTGIAEVIVPANEDGTRATVLRWYKAVGDSVSKDEPLVELETDKVTVEIPAPASGTLIEVLKHPNDDVHPDEVLARLSLAVPVPEAKPPQSVTADLAAGTAASGVAASGKSTSESKPLSPAVRRLLKEHTLAAADIEGSGRDGRITAQDIARQLAGRTSVPGRSAPEGARVAHTPMRRRIAEHMARSVAAAPHVTALFEADVTRVLAHRTRYAAEFERQGARLTLTAYFIAACVEALRALPELNSSFEQDALVLHPDCNIGVGTALGSGGLIVPVIHRAQGMDLLALARRLGELVAAARAGKLTPEEVRGGTFTISNHGVGGSLLAAPIVIHQPQVAILGIGKVERRVRVLEIEGTEAICIRSMCYLTLTIDHRALDAFQANAFLSRIVGTLEQWPDG